MLLDELSLVDEFELKMLLDELSPVDEFELLLVSMDELFFSSITLLKPTKGL